MVVGGHRRRPAGPGRQRGVTRVGGGGGLHRPVAGHGGPGGRRRAAVPRRHLDGLAGERRRAPGLRRPGRRLRRHQGRPLDPAHRGRAQPVGQGPGGPHPVAARRPPRGRPGRRGLPRAGGLPQLPADRAGPGLLRLDHHALGDRQPPHRPRRLRRRAAGHDRARPGHPADPGAHGDGAGRADRGGRRRAGAAPGHRGQHRDRRPAVGGGRLGGGGGLRRPPLRGHLHVDQLPRAVQEDVGPDQHRLATLGPPGALRGGRRARDRRRLPDLAARPACCGRPTPDPGPRPTPSGA